MNMPMENHWNHHYDKDIKELKRLLYSMGDLALQQLQDATEAFKTGDIELAQKVCGLDSAINALEVAVDRAATLIIAKYQPKANDLRLVFGLSKMSTDFERIGDQARNIAKVTRSVIDSSFVDMLEKTEVIASTEKVLSLSLLVLKSLNVVSAVNVLRADEAVDWAYSEGVKLTTHYLKGNPDKVEMAMAYLNILKAYERIGDHATNIAEHVIFISDGEDIRHLRLDDLPLEKMISSQA